MTPWSPVWEAAAAAGLPVAVHTGHSFRALGEVCDTHHDKTSMAFWLTVQFAFQRVISKGIADRYPDLRIAFLEAGCSWVPAVVDRVSDYSGLGDARAGADFNRGYLAKHKPEEYIRRGQIYFGFEVDERLLPFAVEEFGDECWLYGSDIPHGDRLVGLGGGLPGADGHRRGHQAEAAGGQRRPLLRSGAGDREEGARKGVSGGREGAVSRATRSPAPRVSLRRRWWPRTRLFRDPG